MTALPADASAATLDWPKWADILQHYSAATGLVVSAYDENRQRQVGPLGASRLAVTLRASNLWAPEGPGSLLEQALCARCMENGQLEIVSYCTELQVRALPITLFGQVRGAVVHGWVYSGFPSALASDQLARALALDAPKLWRDIRLESPLSPSRLESFSRLLETLIVSTAQQTEAIENLQALARMREVFLASVSHELRSPLSALAYRLQALLLSPLDDPLQIRRTLEAMKRSIGEEERLLEDLIDSAQTRTGKLRIKPVATQLAPIVCASVAAIQPQAENKGVRLHSRGFEPQPDTGIVADEQRLRQVFWNLLSNAIKFTPAGGSVSVELSISGDSYLVAVTDTGSGIEPALQAQLFTTFVKQEHDNEKGLGLGLSIAKHIVELHGGSLRVFSAGPGEGARFTVSLPRRQPGDTSA